MDTKALELLCEKRNEILIKIDALNISIGLLEKEIEVKQINRKDINSAIKMFDSTFTILDVYDYFYSKGFKVSKHQITSCLLYKLKKGELKVISKIEHKNVYLNNSV
ncbi:hypothetical protein FCL53_16980 [Elizabethkingia meningoseptica]|uniref:hypothetical protein n=1 Tax=Elizabethkingia meningoseptica TaxID=238 RepID=UPI0013654D51|nr:hypothetical protein [Elizabethkingia meningoseptica]MVW93658.1 hypothetical protein [Elizabethkingia meningoseptica]